MAQDKPSRRSAWRFHPAWIVLATLLIITAAAVIAIPALFEGRKAAPQATLPPQQAANAQAPIAPQQKAGFTPPSLDAIPSGDFGDVVKLGHDIFTQTQVYAKEYVGNGLNCVNCHLDDGRKADSAPLWAAYVKYPAYREKNHKVNSYEDRLAGCFQFSMNGKAPAYDSKEMVALVTYSYWLAKGAPTGGELAGGGYPKLDRPAQEPDATRGQAVFNNNCALCHGADGQGTKVDGKYAFPPLWGNESYNKGAGMYRVKTAAEFIKANMPLGKGGTLSNQDAWDVAQFINSHERPADPRGKQ